MAINFPDSPAENDSFTSGGKKWIFNGTVWTLITANSYTIPTGEVTTAKILDANVTAAKLASGAAVANIGYTPANIASPTFTGTVVLPSTTSIGTVSNTEIGYVDGVTSAIQTQIDSKLTATTAVTSNRNIIINGAMSVWQRGTSFTTMSAYTADRWFAEAGTGRTVTRQVTGDTTNLPNIQYCLRYQRNSGNTSTAVMVISQSMETVNSIPLTGKTVTYSFYARAGANYSGASNALIAYLVSGTGTDQNQRGGYTTQTLPIMQNATLTTTWQRFSFTATVSTAATELAVLLEYVPVGTAGANDYFETTGFQLEQGAVATPFEFENIGTTLAKCQRYYTKLQNTSAISYLGIGQARNATPYALFSAVSLPVTMRIDPALSASGLSAEPPGGGSNALSSSITAYATQNNAGFYTQRVTGSWSADSPIMLIMDTTASYIAADSEL